MGKPRQTPRQCLCPTTNPPRHPRLDRGSSDVRECITGKIPSANYSPVIPSEAEGSAVARTRARPPKSRSLGYARDDKFGCWTIDWPPVVSARKWVISSLAIAPNPPPLLAVCDFIVIRVLKTRTLQRSNTPLNRAMPLPDSYPAALRMTATRPRTLDCSRRPQ